MSRPLPPTGRLQGFVARLQVKVDKKMDPAQATKDAAARTEELAEREAFDADWVASLKECQGQKAQLRQEQAEAAEQSAPRRQLAMHAVCDALQERMGPSRRQQQPALQPAELIGTAVQSEQQAHTRHLPKKPHAAPVSAAAGTKAKPQQRPVNADSVRVQRLEQQLRDQSKQFTTDADQLAQQQNQLQETQQVVDTLRQSIKRLGVQLVTQAQESAAAARREWACQTALRNEVAQLKAHNRQLQQQVRLWLMPSRTHICQTQLGLVQVNAATQSSGSSRTPGCTSSSSDSNLLLSASAPPWQPGSTTSKQQAPAHDSRLALPDDPWNCS